MYNLILTQGAARAWSIVITGAACGHLRTVTGHWWTLGHTQSSRAGRRPPAEHAISKTSIQLKILY